MHELYYCYFLYLYNTKIASEAGLGDQTAWFDPRPFTDLPYFDPFLPQTLITFSLQELAYPYHKWSYDPGHIYSAPYGVLMSENVKHGYISALERSLRLRHLTSVRATAHSLARIEANLDNPVEAPICSSDRYAYDLFISGLI